MTGSAKQFITRLGEAKAGLLRRFAPRNNDEAGRLKKRVTPSANPPGLWGLQLLYETGFNSRLLMDLDLPAETYE
jgi:hypothetical protein